jgi:hypothetical protein
MKPHLLDRMYDYDLEKSKLNTLSKGCIITLDERFSSQPQPLTTMDYDKSLSAKLKHTKTRIKDQQSFDMYVDGNITML